MKPFYKIKSQIRLMIIRIRPALESIYNNYYGSLSKSCKEAHWFHLQTYSNRTYALCSLHPRLQMLGLPQFRSCMRTRLPPCPSAAHSQIPNGLRLSLLSPSSMRWLASMLAPAFQCPSKSYRSVWYECRSPINFGKVLCVWRRIGSHWELRVAQSL